MTLESVLTCPSCGQPTAATMPMDYCLVRFECPKCRAMLQPKAGDCCVFCSFGSVACPPVQSNAGTQKEMCCRP